MMNIPLRLWRHDLLLDLLLDHLLDLLLDLLLNLVFVLLLDRLLDADQVGNGVHCEEVLLDGGADAGEQVSAMANALEV